jgi:hypothetical protein
MRRHPALTPIGLPEPAFRSTTRSQPGRVARSLHLLLAFCVAFWSAACVEESDVSTEDTDADNASLTTTVSRFVTAGIDDVDVSTACNGCFGVGASRLYLASTYNGQSTALRFRDIRVPKNATNIQAQTASADGVGLGTAGFTVKGIAVDDAAPWSSGADYNDITARPRTSQSTNFVPSAWKTGTRYSVPVDGIVGAIVARAGWQSGNDIAFAIASNNKAGDLKAYAFESGAAQSLLAELSITYTTGGDPQQPSAGTKLWFDLGRYGASYTTSWARNNASKLNALPFDGYVMVAHEITWKQPFVSGDSVFSVSQLNSLLAVPGLTKAKGILLAYGELDVFNATKRANYLTNVTNLLVAMKQQGYTMLAIDNEIGDAKGLRSPQWSGKSAQQVLDLSYQLGKDVGAAINANFPDVVYYQWHGAYMGNATIGAGQVVPQYVFGNWQPGADWSMEVSTRRLMGVMQARGSQGNKKTVCGGQLYTVYNVADYARGADWRRNAIQNTSIVPGELKAGYATKVGIGFMNFPASFKSITPSVFGDQFRAQLAASDGHVITYFSPGDGLPGLDFASWVNNGTRDAWANKIVEAKAP